MAAASTSRTPSTASPSPIAAPAAREADGPTVPSRAHVLLARAEAVREWSLLLGDTTSCALAKDGSSHPAAKFQEGRVAALSELSRRIDDDTEAAQSAAEIGAVTSRWAEQRMPGSGHDRDWAAYRAGGSQALTEIATALETSR